jgi:hypothetical protein
MHRGERRSGAGPRPDAGSRPGRGLDAWYLGQGIPEAWPLQGDANRIGTIGPIGNLIPRPLWSLRPLGLYAFATGDPVRRKA